MTGIQDVIDILDQISLEVMRLPARIKISANQVTVVTGLSDISKRLGLVSAGEFRSGNEFEPGFGFTGVRIGYPPFSYNNEDWSIVGLNSDVLQFGINAADGKAYFGGGAAIIDSDGITLPEGDISSTLADTSAIKWENANDDVVAYIQSARAVSDTASSFIWSVRSLTAGGSVQSFVQQSVYAHDNGDSAYGINLTSGIYAFYMYQDADGQDFISFNHGQADVDFRIESDLGRALTIDGATGGMEINPAQLDADFRVYGDNFKVVQVNAGEDRVEIMNATGGAAHILDGAGTSYFNEPNNDIDVIFEGTTDANLIVVDAGLDAVGIGGAPTTGYKLKVTGQTNISDVLLAFTNTALAAGATAYSAPNKNTLDGTPHNIPWPVGGKLKNLSVRLATAQPGTGSLTCTLYVNGSPTSLVATVPAGSGGGTYTDSTNVVDFTAGDIVRWVVTNNASSTSGTVTALNMQLEQALV